MDTIFGLKMEIKELFSTENREYWIEQIRKSDWVRDNSTLEQHICQI